MIEIYVDGSAINNENPDKPTLGGVGVVFIEDGKVTRARLGITDHVLDGGLFRLDLQQTTNNTTELAVIYLALELIRGKPGPYTIYGDSQYAGNLVFGEWKPKTNEALVAKVKALAGASNMPSVKWKHVRAHADNEYNNYADYLAKSGAYKIPHDEVLNFEGWLLSA